MKINMELLSIAKKAESAEALRRMALERKYQMTADEAERCFNKLHAPEGELADDELADISGGGCGGGGGGGSDTAATPTLPGTRTHAYHTACGLYQCKSCGGFTLELFADSHNVVHGKSCALCAGGFADETTTLSETYCWTCCHAVYGDNYLDDMSDIYCSKNKT